MFRRYRWSYQLHHLKRKKKMNSIYLTRVCRVPPTKTCHYTYQDLGGRTLGCSFIFRPSRDSSLSVELQLPLLNRNIWKWVRKYLGSLGEHSYPLLREQTGLEVPHRHQLQSRLPSPHLSLERNRPLSLHLMAKATAQDKNTKKAQAKYTKSKKVNRHHEERRKSSRQSFRSSDKWTQFREHNKNK